MPCEHIVAGGVRAVVCTRVRRRRCTSCDTLTDDGRLCDFKVRTKSKRAKKPWRTCDRFICAGCAVTPIEDPEKDLCPPHARLWERMKEQRRAKETT